MLSQIIQSLAHQHNLCPERYQHREALSRHKGMHEIFVQTTAESKVKNKNGLPRKKEAQWTQNIGMAAWGSQLVSLKQVKENFNSL